MTALYRIRGACTWDSRHLPGATARAKWRWLYGAARAHRQDFAFCLVKADGQLWPVL